MTGPVRRSVVFVLAGACALAATTNVRAGCGDYLVLDHASLAAHHDSLSKPTQTPCNGPNCHRHDAPPLTPAPELVSAPPTFKAAVVAEVAAEELRMVANAFPEPAARPSAGVALSILRPPRMA